PRTGRGGCTPRPGPNPGCPGRWCVRGGRPAGPGVPRAGGGCTDPPCGPGRYGPGERETLASCVRTSHYVWIGVVGRPRVLGRMGGRPFFLACHTPLRVYGRNWMTSDPWAYSHSSNTAVTAG